MIKCHQTSIYNATINITYSLTEEANAPTFDP